MATALKVYTIEEFSQIPNPSGGHYELHRGELAFVSFPGIRHKLLQAQLSHLLRQLVSRAWHVQEEFPYSNARENDVRSADVAVVRMERVRSAVQWLAGAPELVIEVLSPSNTAAEMAEKAALCLANGTIEFWMIDPDRNSIRVEDRVGPVRNYSAGQNVPQRIPLTAILGAGELAVDEIFAIAD